MESNDNPIFEVTDVLRMFPTFVWKAELNSDLHEKIDQTIIRKLQQIRSSEPNAALHKAWQSDHDLQKMNEFHKLVSSINEAVVTVLAFLKIGQVDFEITGIWVNMNPPDAVHSKHSHPNNFLSGVYYVQTQKGADTINFHDPRLQTEIMKAPVTELTAENTDQVVVSVKNGAILLFPSWLTHSVDANTSDETRISVSFNIMFSAYAETMSPPLW